jgi:hypothetical protein
MATAMAEATGTTPGISASLLSASTFEGRRGAALFVYG